MMNENKPLIIFDFDGTIADSLTIGLSLYNQLSVKYNYPKINNLEEIRKYSGIQFIRNTIKWYYLPFWLKSLKVLIMNNLDEVILYPGIKETLNTLSATCNLGIIGGGPKGYHNDLINRLNIDYFNFVISNKAYNKHKHLEKLKKIHSKQKVILIGDDIEDIRAAKRARIISIAVTWGSSNKEIIDLEKPDAIAEDIDQLLSIIKTFI